MAKSTTKETVPTKSRKREVLGIVILVFSIILLLALVTHSERDWPGSSRAFDQPAENLIGETGAYISHHLLQLIGYSSYFLAAFLIVAGVFVFLHRPLKMLIKPLVSMGILGVAFPLFATLAFQIGSDRIVPEASASFGGMLGIMLAYAGVSALGRAGMILIVGAVVLIVLVMSTNIKPSTFVELAWNALKNMVVSSFNSLRVRREQSKEKTKTSVAEKPSPRKTKTVKADTPKPDSPMPEPEEPVEETPFLTPMDEEDEPDEHEASAPVFEPKIAMRPAPEKRDSDIDSSADAETMNIDENLIDDGGNDEINPFEEVDFEDDSDENAGIPEPIQYDLPSTDLLDPAVDNQPSETREELLEKARRLVESLKHFNIEAEVKQITPGPIVTRYELTLAPGVKVGRVVNLSDDLQLALKARGGIRILAPIPGKAAIGIEVPNKSRQTVYFREIVESESYHDSQLPLVLALGKNTAGEPVVADLAKMPHLLIAGSTGSGKSVCINTLIASILMKATPEEVRMIMIDPKVVELSTYKSIPHLLAPVVSNPRLASNALKWAVDEMESRYRKLASMGVRDIAQFNAKVNAIANDNAPKEGPAAEADTLPYIVVIIDEFADLMVVASNEVEEYIARLAQMARAVGIHLVLATQRPSSDVITGLIKANFPSRIAFKVMQASNSRIILDSSGADKLLGMGDMLFLQVGKPEPIRLHGAYISNDECVRLADFTAAQAVKGLDSIPEEVFEDEDDGGDNALGLRDPESRDTLFFKAARLVVRTNQGSVSLLQRRLKVGYARAARLVDQLELAGIVGGYDGSKAREVLVDEQYIDELESGDY